MAYEAHKKLTCLQRAAFSRQPLVVALCRPMGYAGWRL
jgi:hypothetical protein